MSADILQADAFEGVPLLSGPARRLLNGMAARIADLSNGYPARMTGIGASRSPVDDQLILDESYDALLVASALQVGHEARWNYTVRWPLVLDSTSDTGYALAEEYEEDAATINITELAHTPEPDAATPWYVWCVDVHGEDYPAQFWPRPIGGGGTTGTHKVDTVVRITPRLSAQNVRVLTFELMGHHDGLC